MIQVIVNIHQLSLDTVLAEGSTQLGKETSTFERILAHLGKGGQCEGVRGERGGCEGERGGRTFAELSRLDCISL